MLIQSLSWEEDYWSNFKRVNEVFCDTVMEVIQGEDVVWIHDYHLNRLQGYELFLENNPKWHGRVVLVLVIVPSRIGGEHYKQMKRQIDELTGDINGRFGRIDWSPILYQYKTLTFYPLVSLYSISDIALVAPLRDGMNLIAKEYISTRTEKTGVLILSDMADTAKELSDENFKNPKRAFRG